MGKTQQTSMLASLTFDSDIDNSMPEAATFPVAWGREVSGVCEQPADTETCLICQRVTVI